MYRVSPQQIVAAADTYMSRAFACELPGTVQYITASHLALSESDATMPAVNLTVLRTAVTSPEDVRVTAI